MPNTQQKFSDTLATYQIKVRGRLDHNWSAWFEDMSIQVEKNNGHTITTLRGDISDQAALHGILTRIRDLGLQLILVQLVDEIQPKFNLDPKGEFLMKSYHPLTFTLILLISLMLIGCATEKATTPPQPETVAPVAPTATVTPEPLELWEVIFEKKVSQPVRMAAFINTDFGITGGGTGAGKTHYSTDGGGNWILAETSGGCIYGVDIVDDQTVWVCGRMFGQSFSTEGGVRLSLDGGQTWQPQTTFKSNPNFCPLSFLDSQTGWVYNAYILNSTTDGGQTWQEITPETSANIAAISLLSPDQGYVLDTVGNLFITIDSGNSWEKLAAFDFEKYGELKFNPSKELGSAAVRFTNTEHGMVVLSLIGGGDSRVVFLETQDGGQTWTEETIPAKPGAPYISHDGTYLTINSFSQLTLLRRNSN